MEDNVDLELGLDVQPNPTNLVVRKNISLKLKNSSTKTRGSTPCIAASLPTETSAKKNELLHTSLKDISMGHEAGSNHVIHRKQKLKWNHKVNIIGEKVLDPLIHSCERCLLPILVYGRLLPCKHVFCHSCALKSDKSCPRCISAVNRVERSELGSVFVCTYGGSRHDTTGCHRTYLSKRDLQAHIHHRHLSQRLPTNHSAVLSMATSMVPPGSSVASNQQHAINSSHHMVMQQRSMLSQHNLMQPPQTNMPPPPIEYIPSQHYVTGAPVYLNNPPMQPPQQQQQIMLPQQMINMQQQQQQMQPMMIQQPQQQQQPPQQQPQNIMVMASRSANLISVPLQDEQQQINQQQQQLNQQQLQQQQQMQQQPQQQHYVLQQHMQPAQQQKQPQYVIGHSQNHVVNRPPIVNQQQNMQMIGSYQPANSSAVWPSNHNDPNAMTSQRPPANQMHQYY